MQKIFCDLCGAEIIPNKLNGGIMRNAETFPLLPLGPGSREQLVQKRILQEVWDLCEDCQKFVWTAAEKRKADLQQAKNHAEEILKK